MVGLKSKQCIYCKFDWWKEKYWRDQWYFIKKTWFFDAEKILSLFEELKSHSILDNDNVIKSTVCENTSKPKLHIVHVQMTNECNLSCKYCYAESGKSANSNISLVKLKNTVSEINGISNNVVYTITSGEPLLNPNTIEFMEYLHSPKRYFYWQMDF